MVELVQFTLRKRNPAVSGGRGNDLPENIFDQCVARWPKFAKGRAFKVEAVRESTELAEIVEFLELNGYVANWNRFPTVGYLETNRFQIKGKRVIEDSDIDAAALLVAVPKNEIANSAKHLEDGELLIDPGSLVRGESFGRASGSFFMLCTDRVRALLERKKLNSMAIEEAKSLKGGVSLFRIGSVRKMPSVCSNLVDLAGNPYKDGSDACQIDDLFYPPLLHFGSKQIESVKGIDIVFTSECLGDGRKASWEPKTIVSQRFREIAEQHQLQIDYFPIMPCRSC